MFQIQPQFSRIEEYSALAEKENLKFEVLELFTPGKAEYKEEAFSYYEGAKFVESLHGAFIDHNPVSGDQNIKETSQALTVKSIETAHAIGAKNVVFHCSCFPFLRGGYFDYWVPSFAYYYNTLAEKYDINIFLENAMDVDTSPLLQVMKEIDTPKVKVCLDIGHANYSRDPIEKWFDDLHDYIGYLHLSDNFGMFDDHLEYGKGNLDWQKASDLAKYLPTDTPMTLECTTYEDTVNSLNFLKERHLFGA